MGSMYLDSRGVRRKSLGITSFAIGSSRRRVVIPIFMAGVCYGWQARAIDKLKMAIG